MNGQPLQHCATRKRHYIKMDSDYNARYTALTQTAAWGLPRSGSCRVRYLSAAASDPALCTDTQRLSEASDDKQEDNYFQKISFTKQKTLSTSDSLFLPVGQSSIFNCVYLNTHEWELITSCLWFLVIAWLVTDRYFEPHFFIFVVVWACLLLLSCTDL